MLRPPPATLPSDIRQWLDELYNYVMPLTLSTAATLAPPGVTTVTAGPGSAPVQTTTTQPLPPAQPLLNPFRGITPVELLAFSTPSAINVAIGAGVITLTSPSLGLNNFVLGSGGTGLHDSGFSVIPIADGGSGSASGFAEGLWTPGIAFGGAAVGVTYAAQVGRWLQITTSLGSWVWATGTIILTNEGTSVGNLTITGLPVAAQNLTNSFIPATLHVENFQTV